MPTAVASRPRSSAPVAAAPCGQQRLFVVRAAPRSDPFAELVRQVAEDPANPFNIEAYLWVLEEAPPEPCEACGTLFVPSFDYDGAPAGGHPRRYCSRICAHRTRWARRDERRRSRRLATRQPARWGSAA